MGYSTDFAGRFNLNKKLDADTLTLLKGLSTTRRMKRNMVGYGVEGEFFVDGSGFMGQDNDDTVIDSNQPPRTQPSLWCQWTPTSDAQGLEWDGGEKFYEYTAWLKYLIDSVLVPRGYILNGSVQWRGEDFSDTGTLKVTDNKVTEHHGKLLPMTTELVECPPPAVKKATKPCKTSKVKSKFAGDTDLILVGHKHEGKYYLESTNLIQALKLAHDADAIKGLVKWIEGIVEKRS